MAVPLPNRTSCPGRVEVREEIADEDEDEKSYEQNTARRSESDGFGAYILTRDGRHGAERIA